MLEGLKRLLGWGGKPSPTSPEPTAVQLEPQVTAKPRDKRTEERLSSLRRTLDELAAKTSAASSKDQTDKALRRSLKEHVAGATNLTGNALDSAVNTVKEESRLIGEIEGLEKDLAEARRKLAQVATKLGLGDKQEELMAEAKALRVAEADADLAWLSAQISRASARMYLPETAPDKDPDIAAVQAALKVEIGELNPWQIWRPKD